MEESTSKVYDGADPLMGQMTPGAGSALFVINLCASIAPVQISGKNLPGLENYRLYQVARAEDGRTRHRLRLGFFTSESHADSILTVVRQQYPTAFTACLCDEDRKFARGYLPETISRIERAAPAPKSPIAVVAPAPRPAKPSAAAAARAALAQAPASPPVTKPPTQVASVNSRPKSAPTTVAPATPTASHAAPTKTARDDVQVTLDEFTWEAPALKSAPDRSTSSTVRQPVLSPVQKTQPVLKAPAVTQTRAATASAKAPAMAPAKPLAPKSVVKAAPHGNDAATSMRVKALDLTFSDPPAPPSKPAAKSSEPFHVGKGVDIGELQISLQAEPAGPKASQRAADAASPRAVVAKGSSKGAAPRSPEPKNTPAPLLTPARTAAPSLPSTDLDSTQTIRALTSAELSEDAQDKWFAIQLAASEQPVNLDTMPHLDIFEAYRLYSVATADSGKIAHSLRLGFFKEAVSAEAVSGYLKTFFGTPIVLQISAAEQLRFKDAQSPKRAAAPEESKGPAKIVEMNEARAARPVVPTVTMEVPTPRTDATGSFRMNNTGSFKTGATGSFKPNATGSFRTGASGSFKMNATGAHKVLTPTLKPAAKSANLAARRSEPISRKTGATGKYKVMPKKSLSEQLLEEAREVELSESGIRKLPKNNSLLSKLVGKLTK